jgi:hypothetical protein
MSEGRSMFLKNEHNFLVQLCDFNSSSLSCLLLSWYIFSDCYLWCSNINSDFALAITVRETCYTISIKSSVVRFTEVLLLNFIADNTPHECLHFVMLFDHMRKIRLELVCHGNNIIFAGCQEMLYCNLHRNEVSIYSNYLS